MRTRMTTLLFGTALSAVPGLLYAQVLTQEALAQRSAEWRKTMVQVRGATTVAVDPTTQTATVHVYNPDADTAVVDIRLQFAEPQPVPMPTAEALLTDDSLKEDSVRRATATSDSLEKLWSLADWVQEPLPVRLWLAPHQTVSLKLHLKVPAALKPGTYSAHVVVSTVYKQDGTQIANMLLGASDIALYGRQVNYMKKAWIFWPTPSLPAAAIKMVYTAGATVN